MGSPVGQGLSPEEGKRARGHSCHGGEGKTTEVSENSGVTAKGRATTQHGEKKVF